MQSKAMPSKWISAVLLVAVIAGGACAILCDAAEVASRFRDNREILYGLSGERLESILNRRIRETNLLSPQRELFLNRKRLGDVYLSQGRRNEAKKVYKEALDQARGVVAQFHWTDVRNKCVDDRDLQILRMEVLISTME